MTHTSADLQELADVAVAAAAAAGAVLLPRWREPAAGVGTKSTPTDPVSDADRAAEAAITAVLTERRPYDTILGEETGESGSSGSGVRWLVDPLDGTVNYLYGSPDWAVSIAAEVGGEPVVGVVVHPPVGEVFVAVAGAGCRLNADPVSVSAAGDPATALVGTGFAYAADHRRRQAEVLVSVLPRVRDVRRRGSAALDLAWVACGRLDGFFETGLGPWDVAAGTVLVREAGGTVTRLPSPREGTVGVLAAGPRLHPALERIVGGAG